MIPDFENPLQKWFKEFTKKRAEIVKKNHLENPQQIADSFTFKNMKVLKPDFCPLYKTNERCHEMSEEELICFFCGCPYYDCDIWDEERKEFGGCKINSPYGLRNEYGYWDCSNCILPHTKKFLLQYLKKHLRYMEIRDSKSIG